MVDREKIEQRLMKLEHAVRKLKVIAEHSWDAYQKDDSLKDRAERNLQVAAQACIDISNHIIADHGFRTPIGVMGTFRLTHFFHPKRSSTSCQGFNHPFS